MLRIPSYRRILDPTPTSQDNVLPDCSKSSNGVRSIGSWKLWKFGKDRLSIGDPKHVDLSSERGSADCGASDNIVVASSKGGVLSPTVWPPFSIGVILPYHWRSPLDGRAALIFKLSHVFLFCCLWAFLFALYSCSGKEDHCQACQY